ncbi:MAG: hypothetical protein ACFFDK_03205 [Promethearchaeota archaeon]
MNETQSFKRFPAVCCWIKHLLEGQYLSNDNSYLTLFGKIKRVRIIATITEKRELISTQDVDSTISSDEETDLKVNLEFKLDDGTGLIRAILFQITPDQYSDFIKGDIVDIIGRIGEWNGFPQIYPEIIKKVREPDLILLRNAEIIKEIKFGELEQIPAIIKEEYEIDLSSDEIDINELFENEKTSESDEVKERIYSIIKKYTKEGKGISFEELKNTLELSEEDFKNYLTDLEMESKIYQSEEGVYQSY